MSSGVAERARSSKARVAGRDDAHVARVAAQIVVRARPDHAEQHDLAGRGHQPHQPGAQVLGADAPVDDARVDAPAAQVAQVHVALDAVQVDVALDRGDALAAAQLARDDAAAHVRHADAAARRLQLARRRAGPDADTSPPKVFASTATSGGTSTTRSTPLPASGSERSRPPSSTRVSTTTSPFSNAV